MSGIEKTPNDIRATQPELTADQQAALKRLHQAATQLEGVFLNMLMSEMQKTVPQQSIFGKENSSEQTWQEMLNTQRSEAIANSGTLGIARVLEQQLRSQVLGDASHEKNVQVEGRMEP